MAEDRESIRRRAEEIRATEERRRQEAARSKASNATYLEAQKQRDIEHTKRKEETAEEILEVCGRFALWGAENDIPYNSPSILARGWLLGSRKGEPVTHAEGFGPYTFYSRYSLLVRRDESVRELLLHDVAAERRYRYFPLSMLRFTNTEALAIPRWPQPEEYSIKSIEESIAEFSGEYEVEW